MFVFDKIGLIELGKVLVVCGVELLFIGGFVKILCDVGLDVKDVFEVIGFFEMMDGCVKILYFKVYGGLLVLCDNDDYVVVMDEYGIGVIDLLVVNLYLFEVVLVCGVDYVEMIENIDIGGFVMICVFVKNYGFIIIIVDVEDYDVLLVELEVNDG